MDKLLFGKRLRELRQEKGLKQKELASVAGVSVNMISLLERGRRSPSTETVVRLAKSLGVTADYLLGHSGFRVGRIVTIDELREFLPSEVVDKHKIEILVDDAPMHLSDKTKDEIIKVLRKHGIM